MNASFRTAFWAMCLGLTVPMVLFIGVELISPGSTGRKVAAAAGDRNESLRARLQAAGTKAKPGRGPESGTGPAPKNNLPANPGAYTPGSANGSGSPTGSDATEPQVVLGPELEAEQGSPDSDPRPDRGVAAVPANTRPKVRIVPEIEPVPKTDGRMNAALEERLAGIQTNLDRIGRTLDAQTVRDQALRDEAQHAPRVDPVAQVTELLKQFNEARQHDESRHGEVATREEASAASDATAADKQPVVAAPDEASDSTKQTETRAPEHKPQPVTRIYRPRYLSGSALQALVEPLLTPGVGKTGAADAESADAANGGNGSSGSPSNALVVHDLPQVVRRVDLLITKLDVPPTHVALEAVVITVQLNGSTSQGVDLRALNTSGQTFTIAPVDAEQTSLATGGLTLTRGFGLKSGVLTGDPQAFINALEAAMPIRSSRAWQMTVVDRQSAGLMLDDPFGPSISGAEPATGSLLKIRPVVERVLGDRPARVRLDVRREAAPDAPVPGSRAAALANQIALKAGQTAILGGFFAEQTALQLYRRPGIGKVPFVGDMFLKQAEVIERCETIVLLTPRVIAAPETESQFVRRKHSPARKVLAARKELAAPRELVPPKELAAPKAPAASATIQASHAVPATTSDMPIRPSINPRGKP